MPFGEEIDGTGGRTTGLKYGSDTVRKQFTGYERDSETDLDFAQARYHDYNAGRYSTPDPYMASARRAAPQTFNRYSYVVNNPLRFVDPTGLEGCDPSKEVCSVSSQMKNPCDVGTAGCHPVFLGTITVTAGQDTIETASPQFSSTISPRPIPQPAPTPLYAPGSTYDALEFTPHNTAANLSTAGTLVIGGALAGSEAPGPGNAVGAAIGTCIGACLLVSSMITISEHTIPLTTTPTADPPLPEARGPLVVFHGTDAASANNIMTNGLNVQNAINRGGGDIFWATSDLSTARMFAAANPVGGTPAILQLTLPRAAADAMIIAGSLQVQGNVHMFQRPSWPQVNVTGVFTRVQ